MNDFTIVLDPNGVLHFLVDDPEKPIEVLQCGNPLYTGSTVEWDYAPALPMSLDRVCQGCAAQFGYGATTWPEDYHRDGQP